MLPPRYTPVLTGKAGELTALNELRAADRDALTPLIDVPPIPQPHTPRPGASPAKPPDPGVVLRKLLHGMRLQPEDREVMLDLEGFEAYRPDDLHPVDFVLDQVRDEDPPLIIVTSNNSTPIYREAAARASGQLRGRAIRLRFVPGCNIDDILSEVDDLLAQLTAVSQAVDLLLDFGLVAKFRDNYAETLGEVLEKIPHPDHWRSLTVLGTSIPAAIPSGRFTQAQRTEWLTWQALCCFPRSSDVGFGDYGITGPRRDDNSPAHRPAPHLRYTKDEDHLIWKGRLPDPGEGGGIEAGHTYRDLCTALVNRRGYQGPSFDGRTFSWGDRRIAETAEGARGHGNPTNWVQYATNHHLTKVVRQMKPLIG